jgi:predicted murein hydrolase (TIGR00659 family)
MPAPEHALAALLAVVATVVVYAAAGALYRRVGWGLLHPVLVAIAALIAALKLLGVPYAEYDRGGRILSFFLGPAVVAIGLPLARQISSLGRNARAVGAAIVAGAVTGIATATLGAAALGASDAVVRTLSARSVTTPIAIGIAERVGGIPALIGAVVILSGVFGAVVGPPLLRRAGIRTPEAFGLALGAAAHGAGTARAAEEGEMEAAASGLAIGLMGVATAVLAPLFLALLAWVGVLG